MACVSLHAPSTFGRAPSGRAIRYNAALGSIKTAASNTGGIPLLSLTRNHSKGMANNIMADVKFNSKELQKLIKQLSKKELKRLAKPAAKAMQAAIQAKAPVFHKTVYRYDTPKLIGKWRAPNGKGKRVAEYQPGNLKRSIKIMTFRRSGFLFVGPKRSKNAEGNFTGNKVDGWYAHIVEMRKPFIRPAVDSSSSTVLSILQKDIETYLNARVSKLNGNG
jgi:antitoxin component YwqK of YwqJK toxin-antitoxin module